MKLEVLISTMHQTDYTVLNQIGLLSDAVVVNQCDHDSEKVLMVADHKVTWINSTQRGLSRSRNMAIKHSSADILLLADDDEMLRANYVQTILDGFQKYPDAAAVGFQVKGIEEKFKDYSLAERKVGFLQSMKMASVEIAFRRKSLEISRVCFNENIGTGTKYMMGEENTLLFQLLAKKQKIYYIPSIIADLHIGESTWFSGYNKAYMFARGAVFTAMSKQWSDLLILQFAVRHRSLYQQDMSMLNAIQYMFAGKKEYLSLINDK